MTAPVGADGAFVGLVQAGAQAGQVHAEGRGGGRQGRQGLARLDCRSRCRTSRRSRPPPTARPPGAVGGSVLVADGRSRSWPGRRDDPAHPFSAFKLGTSRAHPGLRRAGCRTADAVSSLLPGLRPQAATRRRARPTHVAVVSILKDGKTPVAKAPANPIETAVAGSAVGPIPLASLRAGQVPGPAQGHGQARQEGARPGGAARDRAVGGAGLVNKAELVARVARDTGLTKADVLRVLDAVLDQVARSLRKGEPVKLVDFGTFLVSAPEAARRPQPAHGPGDEGPGAALAALRGRQAPEGARALAAPEASAAAPRAAGRPSRLQRPRGPSRGCGPVGARPRAGPRPPRARPRPAPWAARPSPWIDVPLGDMYFATVSTSPPSGSGTGLRDRRAPEGALAHELGAPGIEERRGHDLARARGAVVDEHGERAAPRRASPRRPEAAAPRLAGPRASPPARPAGRARPPSRRPPARPTPRRAGRAGAAPRRPA